MSEHLTKSIDLADKITSLAEDGLSGLDRTIRTWPGEFRHIIWFAVAEIAQRRAAAAKEEK